MVVFLCIGPWLFCGAWRRSRIIFTSGFRFLVQIAIYFQMENSFFRAESDISLFIFRFQFRFRCRYRFRFRRPGRGRSRCLLYAARAAARSDPAKKCANKRTNKKLVSYLCTYMKSYVFDNIICQTCQNRAFIRIMQFDIHNIICQLSGNSGWLIF